MVQSAASTCTANGSRCSGVQSPGGYAEYVVVPAWALIPLPDSLSFEQAAAIQTTFGTVWHALTGRVSVREGEWVLVNAAGSGVGTAGIQVARLLGGRVIASAGSDVKLERALDLGAEATVNYAGGPRRSGFGRSRAAGASTSSWSRSVVTYCAAIRDGISRRMARSSPSVRTPAKLVPVDVITLFRHQWSLIGSVRATADELRHCVDLVAEGKLAPVIHASLPLAQAAEAHRILEAREQFGKVLLVP